MNEQGTLPSNPLDPTSIPEQSAIYQIRVTGHLGSNWTDWFEGLTITQEDNGDTLLTGSVVDQAALYGLLKKVRDIGLPLVSVNPVRCNDSPLEEVKNENK